MSPWHPLILPLEGRTAGSLGSPDGSDPEIGAPRSPAFTEVAGISKTRWGVKPHWQKLTCYTKVIVIKKGSECWAGDVG